MNNLTNYHSHTSFCDGKAPMEAFIAEAVRQGFTSYGVSSHAPLPFRTRWTIDDREQTGLYLQEFARLKRLYGDRIELYVGLEIDYMDEDQQPANDYFQSLPLDYRIGSVHLLHSTQGEIVDIDTKPEVFREHVRLHLGGDLKRVVLAYFDKLMRMIGRGGFDFIGHADKISYNVSCCEPNILGQQWYKDKISEYFTFIAEKGAMIEVNTKTLHRNGFLYPNKEHFGLIRTLGIPVVVNSDAHLPELINSGRPEALRLLKASGISAVWQLERGVWTEVPIGE